MPVTSITTGNVVTSEVWLPMRLMEPTVPYMVEELDEEAPDEPEAATGVEPELLPSVMLTWSPSAIWPISVSSTVVLMM